MLVPTLFLAALGASALPAADHVILNSWDASKGPTHRWLELNDPVMGGQSTATFTTDQNYGIFNGTARIVPSLQAPGFCNAETLPFQTFPSAQGYDKIFIVARTNTPEYAGFKLSWAGRTFNPQFDSFKTRFTVSSSEWEVVEIPLSQFSKDWSSFTGDCFTKDPNGKQHFCCSAEHPENCATDKDLGEISQLGIWAEGYAGDFHLEVLAIGAGTYTL